MMQSTEWPAIVLDTIPMVMRTVFVGMQTRHSADISAPQFHAMMFLHFHDGASLSELSTRMGATLSATSKLIDGLVDRQFVMRQTSSHDRRRVVLSLTEGGQDKIATIQQECAYVLGELLSALTESERATVTEAMTILRTAIANSHQDPCSSTGGSTL